MTSKKLVEMLECPVCMEVMEGSILQCRNGHSVCKRCRIRMTDCPLCGHRYGSKDIRCLALENLRDIISKTDSGADSQQASAANSTLPKPGAGDKGKSRSKPKSKDSNSAPVPTPATASTPTTLPRLNGTPMNNILKWNLFDLDSDSDSSIESSFSASSVTEEPGAYTPEIEGQEEEENREEDLEEEPIMRIGFDSEDEDVDVEAIDDDAESFDFFTAAAPWEEPELVDVENSDEEQNSEEATVDAEEEYQSMPSEAEDEDGIMNNEDDAHEDDFDAYASRLEVDLADFVSDMSEEDNDSLSPPSTPTFLTSNVINISSESDTFVSVD